MPKRRRGAVDSDDSEVESSPAEAVSEDDFAPRRRRLRRAAENKEEEEDSDPQFNVVLKTNGKRKAEESDGSYYSDGSSSDDDNSSAASEAELEYSDGGFVVDSDDNVVPNSSLRRQNRRRQRRRLASARQQGRRARGRSRRNAVVEDDDDETGSDDFSEGSLAEELRELRGERAAPRKPRHYRERAPVNYEILPPPTVEEVATARAAEERQAAAAAAARKDTRTRRLFDVRGPFGGQDVHTIFKVPREDLERAVKRGRDVAGAIDRAASALAGPGKPGAPGITAAARDTQGDDADVDPIDVQGDVDFSMVGGLDDYVAKLKEMVSLPLLYPELYEKFGITPPRGVLFHGPPGTGKTLMARALAASHRQEKVTFYMRKGADVLSKWIGESERQLRVLFEEAQRNQPSIIFFDEIDGLAPVRSARQEQHHASIVSTLLALMDGMDNRGQVVIIGATNRPDSVDPALRRPGRFDREFYFPLPDVDARKRILEIHTAKWSPQLPAEFLMKIAEQTKGFGGADLRAVATEAAMLAIQRAYPQIYGSEARLRVDPSTIEVRAQDFELALEKIQPSTAREAGTSLAQPLPPRIRPLLQSTFAKLTEYVQAVFPRDKHEKVAAALFLPSDQFQQALNVKRFRQSRVHRPRLLITGARGNGQIYLSRALAHMLEGVYVRELSTATLFGSATAFQPESAVVSAVAEVRQRAPACLLLPQIDEWLGMPHLCSLLAGLLRGLLPSEQVFVVGTGEMNGEYSPLRTFFDSQALQIELDGGAEVLSEFFNPIWDFVKRSPLQCLEASEMPRPEVKALPLAETETSTSDSEANKNEAKNEAKNGAKNEADKHGAKGKTSSVFSQSERAELRVRSQLKLKLGLILDGFRQRYRRFRKPVVDETQLAYLFEDPPVSDEDEAYKRTPDNMILEVASDKKYYNMDLETIEDRLWNGFYCEPEQFLQDIEMIYHDSVTLGERERTHKASEMVANAQVAIDDISLDKPFILACEELHGKDAQARLDQSDADQATLGSGAPADADADADAGADDADMQVEADGVEHVDTAETAVEDAVKTATGSDAGHAQNGAAALQTLPTEVAIAEEIAEEVIGLPPPKNVPDKVAYSEDAFAALKTTLLSVAARYTLEELEELYATLTDIAWKHREEWDRTSMLTEMTQFLQQ